jgi:hypothetical protein
LVIGLIFEEESVLRSGCGGGLGRRRRDGAEQVLDADGAGGLAADLERPCPFRIRPEETGLALVAIEDFLAMMSAGDPDRLRCPFYSLEPF